MNPPDLELGSCKSFGRSVNPAPQSESDEGNVHSVLWPSELWGWSAPPSHPPNPSDLRRTHKVKMSIRWFLTVWHVCYDVLLCAMCWRSTASGPYSCSGEVAAPVTWSKSSRRTTEGCLQTACSKTSSNLCLILSALLPSKFIHNIEKYDWLKTKTFSLSWNA